MLARNLLRINLKRAMSTATATETRKPSVQYSERSLNEVQLIGRVGEDPKLFGNSDEEGASTEERKILSFSLATEQYIGQNEQTSEPIYRTDWHRITVWPSPLQTTVETIVRKGDRVFVSGALKYRLVKFDDGVERLVSNIWANNIIFLSKLK
jgi:single stranded DNA-binding protein